MQIKKRNPLNKDLWTDGKYHMKTVGAKKGRGSYHRKEKYPIQEQTE